jgi:hypothetical protein
MVRRAVAVVLVLTLNPALVRAQEITITVSAPAADVYKGPSTGSPIIGHVSRGAVLPVTRELGSWVKVNWPDAQDGTGYVHVTMGRVGPRASEGPLARPSPSGSAPAPVTTTIPPLTRTSIGERVVPSGQLNVTPASHIVGVGGLFASGRSVGATVRGWHHNHLGVQVGLLRDAQTSTTMPGRITTLAFEPGIVYGLFDRVSDYIWLRPYVGSSLDIRRQTLSLSPVAAEPLASNTTGFRVFGGAEFTFAAMPRFGLSADLGYRRADTTFDGFAADRVSLAIAGHWYLK